MAQTPAEHNLEARAQLFKALGHPARLLILNLIEAKPRHGEELAAILNLNPATVSHHLSKLTEVGLLGAQKDQYYQTYSLKGELLNKSMAEMMRLSQPGLETAVATDAYRLKVLNTFFKHGRLVQIPAQLKKRQIILEQLAREFEPERDYSEREVNLILLDFHEDVASLRREFIATGLMARDKGVYRRKMDAVHERVEQHESRG
jgi:ArsR family transcriptional regulator, arsenate/arsenite/antimonite-responsive transcriptional repressor